MFVMADYIEKCTVTIPSGLLSNFFTSFLFTSTKTYRRPLKDGEIGTRIKSN